MIFSPYDKARKSGVLMLQISEGFQFIGAQTAVFSKQAAAAAIVMSRP